MMVVQSKDLWSLTRGLPWVDACDLAEAIAAQVVRGDLDFRSRLLIRDSLDALKQYRGDHRLFDWLRQCSVPDRIEAIWKENLGEAGFPSLRRRIVDKTTPDAIRGCLRELGQSLQRPLQVHLAGSAALILQGYLTRNTDDLALIDEVPAELCTQQRLLDDLQRRYGLHLGHVPSHYYPSGWQNRVHSEPPYQRLRVFLLDVYDVFLGKLFSKRERDLDDLRAVVSQIDKIVLVRRLQDTAQAFLKDAYMRLAAKHNWYILFGEPLPT